jgi:hypothetical protein
MENERYLSQKLNMITEFNKLVLKLIDKCNIDGYQRLLSALFDNPYMTAKFGFDPYEEGYINPMVFEKVGNFPMLLFNEYSAVVKCVQRLHKVFCKDDSLYHIPNYHQHDSKEEKLYYMNRTFKLDNIKYAYMRKEEKRIEEIEQAYEQFRMELKQVLLNMLESDETIPIAYAKAICVGESDN